MAVATAVRAPVRPDGLGRRIPQVDGLRAVAVTGVIAFHFGLGPRGGFLGVDLFFVISGYVITRLLLVERQETGGVRWTRFWERRAWRLLPAVLVVLAAVQLWVRFGAPAAGLRATVNDQTLAALVYGSNWYAVSGGVGYWDADADRAPLTHLWSLAVEEQFYLVWPLLFAACFALTRSRRALTAVAACGAVASYASAAVLARSAGTDRAYLGTDCRAGALLLGVLCAVALTRHSPMGGWDRRLPAEYAKAARVVFGAAVGCLAVLWSLADVRSPWLYGGGLAVAGCAAAVVIVSVVAVPGTWTFLSSRPFALVGRLSYSLYLWHWPVKVLAARQLSGPVLLAVEVAATAVLAALCHFLVEEPARRLRGARFLPLLVVPVLLTAASALVLQPPPPAEQGTDLLIHGPAH